MPMHPSPMGRTVSSEWPRRNRAEPAIDGFPLPRSVIALYALSFRSFLPVCKRIQVLGSGIIGRRGLAQVAPALVLGQQRATGRGRVGIRIGADQQTQRR